MSDGPTDIHAAEVWVPEAEGVLPALPLLEAGQVLAAVGWTL